MIQRLFDFLSFLLQMIQLHCLRNHPSWVGSIFFFIFWSPHPVGFTFVVFWTSVVFSWLLLWTEISSFLPAFSSFSVDLIFSFGLWGLLETDLELNEIEMICHSFQCFEIFNFSHFLSVFYAKIFSIPSQPLNINKLTS